MSEAAAKAGMSTDNWGHIERGYQSMGRDQEPRVVIPPADTLAHMAKAVNISPEELTAIGRADAADALRDLQQRAAVAVPAAPAVNGERSAARHLLDSLRARAVEGDRSLGEMLVDEGLADPEELIIPDAMPPDPTIEEINASNISEETKAKLIRLHLENRARRFEASRLKRKKPGG